LPTVKVGDTASRTRRVDARDIELFTELTGDRNPLHYDADVAAGSRFGRVIVQGGVTSGLLNAVVAEDLPGPGSVFLHVGWVTTLRTTITNQDGVVVLDGTALVWSEPL
jgi:acyl dehydratase